MFRALELAPADTYLRQKVAADFEARGRIESAIAVIKPAALTMRHDGDESERERRRRAQRQERFRTAGRVQAETPREMLTRLEARLAQGAAAGEQPASTPQ